MPEQSVETQLALLTRDLAEFRAESKAGLTALKDQVATQNGNVARLTEWKGEHNAEHRELRGIAAGLQQAGVAAQEQSKQVVTLPRWLIVALIAGMFSLGGALAAALLKIFFT